MGRIRFTHNSFATGLINKRVQGNTEFEQYNNALRECLNANVLPTGGIQKRAGSKFLSYLDSQNTRLLSLSYSVEESYILALSTYSLEIFTKYGKLEIEGGKVSAIALSPKDKELWFITDFNTLKHETMPILDEETITLDRTVFSLGSNGDVFFNFFALETSAEATPVIIYKIDKSFKNLEKKQYNVNIPRNYTLHSSIWASDDGFGEGVMTFKGDKRAQIVHIKNDNATIEEYVFDTSTGYSDPITACDGVFFENDFVIVIGSEAKVIAYTKSGKKEILKNPYKFIANCFVSEKFKENFFVMATDDEKGSAAIVKITKDEYSLICSATDIHIQEVFFAAWNNTQEFGVIVLKNRITTNIEVYGGTKQDGLKFITNYTLNETNPRFISCSFTSKYIMISESGFVEQNMPSMLFYLSNKNELVFIGTFTMDINKPQAPWAAIMFVEPSSKLITPFLWKDTVYLPYIQNNNITFFFNSDGVYVLDRIEADNFVFFKYTDPFSIPPLTFLNETPTTLTPTESTPVGTYTIEASEDTFTDKDVGSYLVFLYTLDARLYTIYLAIDSVKTSLEVVAHIDNDLSSSPNINEDGQLLLPNTRKVGNWQIGCMNDTRGWPTAAALFEGRLFLCNTKSYATGIWGSNLAYNDLLNFAIDSTASSGLQARIKIENCSTILWLVGINKLFLGTVGGICVIGSGTYQDEGLSPGKFVARFFDSTRPSPLPPVKVKDAIFFVDNSGANVYEIVLDSQLGAYKANNVSLLSNEYTSWGIISHAFLQVPYNSYWCVLKNGELCSFTYQKNNNVLAWSRHKIGGSSAIVTSVACMPFENKDHLFLVVTRLIDQQQVTTLEYISPPFNPITDDVYKQHFCDSYISFENRVAIKNIIKNKPSRIKSGTFPLYSFLPVQEEYDAIFLQKRLATQLLFVKGIMQFDSDVYVSFGNIDLQTMQIVKDSSISILEDLNASGCYGCGTNQDNGVTLVAISNPSRISIIRSNNFIDWEIVEDFPHQSVSPLFHMRNNYNNVFIPKFVLLLTDTHRSTVYINTDGTSNFKKIENIPYFINGKVVGCCDIPGTVYFLWFGYEKDIGRHFELISTNNFQGFYPRRINIDVQSSSFCAGLQSSSLQFGSSNLLRFRFNNSQSNGNVLIVYAVTGRVLFFKERSDFCIFQKLIYVSIYDQRSKKTIIKIYSTINDLNNDHPFKEIKLNIVSDYYYYSEFKIINGSLYYITNIPNPPSLKGKLVLVEINLSQNKYDEHVFDNVFVDSFSIPHCFIADYADNPGAQETALACKAAPFKLKNFNLDSFEIYRQFTPKGPLMGFDYSTFESMYPLDADPTIAQKTKYYCGIKLTNVTKLEKDHITAKTDKLVKNMWIMLSGNDFNPEKESFDSLASKQMYVIDKIVGFQIYLKDSLGDPVYFDNTINPTTYGLSLYAVVQDDKTFNAFEFFFDCGNDAQIIVPGKKEDYKLGDLVFVRKVVSPSSINNKALRISSIETSSLALDEVAITVWDIEKSIVSKDLFAPLDIYNSLEYNPYLEDNGFLYKSMTSVIAKHLANQEVVIMCDGNYIGKNTVAPDGTLLLQNPATYVVIGLEYTMEVETTPLSGGSQVGSSIGGVTSQKEIVLSLYYSLGGRYGTEKDNTYPIPYKRKVQLNKPQDLFTGNLSLPVIKSKNIYERCTYLEHSEPVNFTVLSLTEETSVSDS